MTADDGLRRNRTYYAGDLRAALLDAARLEIAEQGAAAASLRGIARRAGVSHAAPAHHFGDRAGLFTALAVQAFDELARDLQDAGDGAGVPARSEGDARVARLGAAGLAYLRFAERRPAVFQLMFRPDLLHPDDELLRAAMERAYGELAKVVRQDPVAAVGAWSVVHGLAVLWLDGALGAGRGREGEATLPDIGAAVVALVSPALAGETRAEP